MTYITFYVNLPQINTMARKRQLTNKVARIENFFVENAHYVLNVREQKIILHLAANLNTHSDNFNEQIVSVKELELMLKSGDSKWGGVYKEMLEFSERIVGKKIKFPTDVMLNGERLPGFITWFSSITPCYNDNDEVCLKFRFNADLKPFLLKLNEYVRINLSEIAGLNSFYSLRLYQIFRATLAKTGKYMKTRNITYELSDLRKLLGVKGKYTQYKYFNRDIIGKATDEINEHTQIFVKYESLRTGRKVTHLKFYFCDKKDHKEYTQLSFLDKMPAIDGIDLRTPEERKAKQKQFNYTNFKKAYPLVFKQQRQTALDEYRNLKSKNRDKIIEQVTENLCKSWYSEFA